MSIVGDLVSGGAQGILGGLTDFVDSLFTSDEERLTKQEALERLRQEPHKLQALINLQEAKHASVFVAGWRPFIGWVCGFALGWIFVLRDLVAWGLEVAGSKISPPALDGTGELITLILALLGLGGLRTIEGIKGVARKSIKENGE